MTRTSKGTFFTAHSQFWGLITVILITICFSYVPSYPEKSAVEASSNYVVNDSITVSGLHANVAKVEYMSDSTSSTPIVIICEGLGGLTDYTDTLQHDLTQQGYVTIAFNNHFPDPFTNKGFTDAENYDVECILNFINSGLMPKGDKTNLLLLGQSAGGCTVLTYNYSNYSSIKAILAVVPAFNYQQAIPSTIPKFLIVGQIDDYAPDGLAYYSQLNAPKAYVEVLDGNHFLGITDTMETIPNKFTTITEGYVFAFVNYAMKGSEDGWSTINNACSDSNIVSTQNLLPQIDATPTPSPSPSASPTASPTPTPSPTSTPTPTPSPSPSPTPTASPTPTPTATPSPTPKPSPTPTSTATPTPTPTPTSISTPASTLNPASALSPTLAPTPTDTPTPTPTVTPTSTPTAEPTGTIDSASTFSPTASPTDIPSTEPSPTPVTPELTLLALVVGFLAVLSVTLIIEKKHR